MLNSKIPFWLPLTPNGFIDHKAVFQIVHGGLHQPYGVLDEMTAYEVSWLIEDRNSEKKDYYEMISYAVKNAMISVNKGKDYRLFEDEEKDEKVLTQEKKDEDVNYLLNVFNEG